MLRFDLEPLPPSWSEFLQALFRDLEPLGHSAICHPDGGFTVELLEAGDMQSSDGLERARLERHLAFLEAHRRQILEFERDFDDVFVDVATFEPSAVSPVLQAVDFRDDRHKQIIEYIKLYQSVTPGKSVGRRMGLLMWDIGQGGSARLIGAAVLASPRFSQAVRDSRLGWARDFPRTSTRHDPTARATRLRGLDRMMQLTVACALPPYNLLSGAWLAALAPFTDVGFESFRRSQKNPDPDADLAAIVTTTAKGASGAPFRGHRVAQLARKSAAAPGAQGDLFAQARPGAGLSPPRSSFEFLVSEQLRRMALELFRTEQPARYASLRAPDRSAMAYALRRLKLRRWIFQGNEIGVHLGMLGGGTLEALRTGQPRPVGVRYLLDWNRIVGVWSRRFLPAPELVGESSVERNKEQHREARRKRVERARELPANSIRLSSRLRKP